MRSVLSEAQAQYAKRFVRVLCGIAVNSVGITLLLQANIGLDPWNVFHSGVQNLTSLPFGVCTMITGASVLAIAMCMGESFGFGMLADIFVTGTLIEVVLATGLIPKQTGFWPGLLMMLVGFEVLSLGTTLYMSAGLGSGPRDALMVACAKRLHWPVGLCRSATEVIVTVLGFWMGGTVGVGTMLAALAIGLFFECNFKLFRFNAAATHQETVAETVRNLKKAGKQA